MLVHLCTFVLMADYGNHGEHCSNSSKSEHFTARIVISQYNRDCFLFRMSDLNVNMQEKPCSCLTLGHATVAHLTENSLDQHVLMVI